MIPAPTITGLGLVTPLGTTAAETWDALIDGRFIRDHARARGEWAAERVTALALQTARQAVGQAGWRLSDLEDDSTALVIGTSKGPVDAWLDDCTTLSGGLADIADALAGALRLGQGPRLTISAACASGLHALIRGAMLIGGGEADRVLVVAAESSLHPLFAGSFRRLGVLPPEGFGCRPFDEQRAGFLMSEAAAAVCLEPAERSMGVPPMSRGMGRTPMLRIDRFAMGGDATHITGTDPAGSTLRHLLRQVIAGRPVDLVHAHGTGTAANDPLELAALDDVLADVNQEDPPVLYSHKGPLGHSLGAAGLVSIVLNCLMHQHGVVPGNIQTNLPLPAQRVRIDRYPAERRIRRSLAIAAGFGGPTAVVGLQSS